MCVELSEKYIHDRFLPDKAIDLMDQAGSKVKIENFKRPEAAKSIESKLEKLMIAEDEAISKGEKLRISKKQDKLFDQYKKIIQSWSDENKKNELKVSPDDIAYVLSKKINVPLHQISRTSEKEFLNLEKELKKHVIGQEKAIQSICKSLIRNRAGLNDENKPIGSFLLLGSSGTGKTYTAKTLAEKLFGSKDNFIHISMTEYSEGYSGSKLIGSSPGYVGYESSGQLTEKVRKKPYSVVLFDEIEKAHSNVTQTLLQILDEGKIKDNMGREINFNNCVIVMTGNIGSSIAHGNLGVGFGAISELNHETEKQERIKKEVLKSLSPEFLNRIDELIVFEEFKDKDFYKIIELHINELKSKLKEKGYSLFINKASKNELLSKVTSLKDGARPIYRILQESIVDPLSAELLKSASQNFKKIKVAFSKSGFSFNFE